MPDSPRADQDALSILQRLRAAGFEAYFAGGCVRDLLMVQTPKDFDVATSAAPNQVRGLFKNTQAVGAAFGVILVREGKTTVEVATLRTDLEYRDGRRPEGVKFATAEEDAQRRDFTINGLFLDPVENKIIDYVGGQADLAAKTLRAIGNADARFAEDHLRMLRAVRFASRFGFEIEPATAAAIKSHAHQIKGISPERIAEELRKMLMPVTRDGAYRMLWDFGLIRILMRFVSEMEIDLSVDPFELFPKVGRGTPISFGLALAALTLDFQLSVMGRYDPLVWFELGAVRRAAIALRRALKISNDEERGFFASMDFLHLLDNVPPTVARLKRFLAQPCSSDATLLMTALAQCGLMSGRIHSVLSELDHWRKTDYAPTPLITGDDLTTAGATPGPKFKIALDAAYDAQLEDRIATKEQAMELAMGIIGK